MFFFDNVTRDFIQAIVSLAQVAAAASDVNGSSSAIGVPVDDDEIRAMNSLPRMRTSAVSHPDLLRQTMSGPWTNPSVFRVAFPILTSVSSVGALRQDRLTTVSTFSFFRVTDDCHP